MDIRESLNDQIYISAFNDPTVALETTQFNQTYAFEQTEQTYGDVSDETNLSPDWQPYYQTYGENKYVSTDLMEWNLLSPTRIQDITVSPDEILNTTTTLSNDYIPVSRDFYSQDLSYADLSTTQTQVGKLGYSSWSWTNGSSGHADV